MLTIVVLLMYDLCDQNPLITTGLVPALQYCTVCTTHTGNLLSVGIKKKYTQNKRHSSSYVYDMSGPVLLVAGDSSCSGTHREDEVNEPVSASAAMMSASVALLLTRPSRGHVVVVIGCPNVLTVNHAISHGKRLRSTAQSLYFVFQSPDLFLVMHPLGFDLATLCLQLLCIASLKNKSQRQVLLSN